MGQELLSFQTRKSRAKVLERFCFSIAILALGLSFLYINEKMYFLAVLCGVVLVVFLGFVFLNRRDHHHSIRRIIVATSIFAVIIFSLTLSFDSGIYLYLFVAPLLTYLLYGYDELRQIKIIFLAFVITFSIIYSVDLFGVPAFYKLDEKTLHWIYIYNLWSTFIMSFSIVTYFAMTNYKYIINLKRHQNSLESEIFRRESSENLLRNALNDREELLAEIHHRVKNNLALITALINLQLHESENNGNTKEGQQLLATKNRIYAISLVYNLIYHSKSIDQVNIRQFIQEFYNEIKKDHSQLNEVQVKIEEGSIIDLKSAVPLALIFNEVLCNCALNLEEGALQGNIFVELKRENQHLVFYVGAKKNEDSVLQCEFNQLGLLIVESLSEQLDGTFELGSNELKQFRLQFPAS